MSAHGQQPDVEFSTFPALQISNAVSQTLGSNKSKNAVSSLFMAIFGRKVLKYNQAKRFTFFLR